MRKCEEHLVCHFPVFQDHLKFLFTVDYYSLVCVVKYLRKEILSVTRIYELWLTLRTS